MKENKTIPYFYISFYFTQTDNDADGDAIGYTHIFYIVYAAHTWLSVLYKYI